MDSAPIEFQIDGSKIAFPAVPSALPGLSSAAVARVMDTVEAHKINPDTLDAAGENRAKTDFAFAMGTLVLAETVRRMQRLAPSTLDALIEHFAHNEDMDIVLRAAALVIERNKGIFTPAAPAAPEAPANP